MRSETVEVTVEQGSPIKVKRYCSASSKKAPVKRVTKAEKVAIDEDAHIEEQLISSLVGCSVTSDTPPHDPPNFESLHQPITPMSVVSESEPPPEYDPAVQEQSSPHVGKQRCQGINKSNGKQCSKVSMPGQLYCRIHLAQPTPPPVESPHQCIGMNKSNKKPCSNQVKAGELYCHKHKAQATSQSCQSDP